MIHISRMGLRAVETAWVGRTRAIAGVGEVGILVEQLKVESVDRQRERAGMECRFALRILRDRMGAEIMVERLVLTEDDNEMLDRSRRVGLAAVALEFPKDEANRNIVTGKDSDLRKRPSIK